MKVKTGLQKGQLVYLRRTWGDDIGKVDETITYKIRAIGKKMCTLDRVDLDSRTLFSSFRKGSNYYLCTKQESDDYRARGYVFYHCCDWSQLLVPLGAAGWDPDMNF